MLARLGGGGPEGHAEHAEHAEHAGGWGAERGGGSLEGPWPRGHAAAPAAGLRDAGGGGWGGAAAGLARRESGEEGEEVGPGPKLGRLSSRTLPRTVSGAGERCRGGALFPGQLAVPSFASLLAAAASRRPVAPGSGRGGLPWVQRLCRARGELAANSASLPIPACAQGPSAACPRPARPRRARATGGCRCTRRSCRVSARGCCRPAGSMLLQGTRSNGLLLRSGPQLPAPRHDQSQPAPFPYPCPHLSLNAPRLAAMPAPQACAPTTHSMRSTHSTHIASSRRSMPWCAPHSSARHAPQGIPGQPSGLKLSGP